MIPQKYNNQILDTLNVFEADLLKDPHYLNAQRDFFVSAVRDAVTNLNDIANRLRTAYPLYNQPNNKVTESGAPLALGASNAVYNLSQRMLTIGQSLASLLTTVRLRDSIVSPLENWYGVSFSSAKIYPEYINKSTQEVFYLTSDLRIPARTSVNILKNGDMTTVNMVDFQANYERRAF